MVTCPECGSSQILDGLLQGYSNAVFVEKGTENKLRPNAYRTTCRACLDCGLVFDLRIVSTGKRKVGKDRL